MAQAYQTGAPMHELTEQFGLHRTTCGDVPPEAWRPATEPRGSVMTTLSKPFGSTSSTMIRRRSCERSGYGSATAKLENTQANDSCSTSKIYEGPSNPPQSTFDYRYFSSPSD